MAIEFGIILPLMLMGLPELAPERYPTRLVTEGLYGRMRHLRYVQVSLALIGYMLIANYPALSVVLALWLLILFLIVRLEEGELRERFGSAYEEVVDVHHAPDEDPPQARAPELAPLVEFPQQVPASFQRCCCGDIPIQPGTPSLQADIFQAGE